jgi:4-carboxymuconolactone decarboxylase
MKASFHVHHLAITAAASLALLATIATAQERLPALKFDQLNEAQRRATQDIQSGPRKRLGGPFNAWMRSPDLALRLQKVGEYFRTQTTVLPRLGELAILISARTWNDKYEWAVHYPMALRTGITQDVAADIATGRRPTGMKPDEGIIYDFCVELVQNRGVSDVSFEAAKRLLGEQAIVDLIAIMGFNAMVSMTLNVARTPLPTEAVQILPDLPE